MAFVFRFSTAPQTSCASSEEPLGPLSASTGGQEFPTVQVQFASRRALLSAARSQQSKLTLFVASDLDVPVGSGVELRITIAGTSKVFELFGRVFDHTWAGNGSRASGLTIGFDGEEKRHAAEMIAFCADRPPAMGTAVNQRQKIALRCKLRGTYGLRDAVTVDLSRSGAFISTEMLRGFRSGSQISVLLEPRVLGVGGTWLNAKVIWQGDKDDRPGIGIQFQGLTKQQTRVLNKYLRTPDS